MDKRKRILTGIIFLLAITLLYIGISFLKGRNIFSSNSTYYVKYHDVTGLSDSSPIYANGVHIGIVDGILYNYEHPEDIVVRIHVNKKLAIPKGSIAMLDTELLGSVSMKLLLADNKESYLSAGDTLPGELNRGMMAELSSMMPNVMALIPQLDSILNNVHTLLADSSISNTMHQAEALSLKAQNTLNELSSVMTNVNNLANAYQQAGKELDTLSRKAKTIVTDGSVESLITNLDATIQHLQAIATSLDNGEGTASRIIQDPALYNNLNQVCDEANELIQDVKNNPSKYIRLFGRNKEK